MILDRILAVKREELADRKRLVPTALLEQQARGMPPARDALAALRRSEGDAIRLIAEFKRASPSKGVIRCDLAPEEAARQYEEAGAAALSVLTDTSFFQGTMDDLRAVRSASKLPLLCKEFILHRYQLLEARVAGADMALLIVAALADDALAELHRRATQWGLAVLVETHTADEIERALAAGARIIGINSRDLKTFHVDIRTALRLRAMIPPEVVVVAESGIRTRKDVLRLEEAGFDAMLVGETLMSRQYPGAAARGLLGAE